MAIMGIERWLEPAPPPVAGEAEPPLWQKWLWFGGLMLAGLVTVGVAAYVLRAVLFIG